MMQHGHTNVSSSVKPSFFVLFRGNFSFWISVYPFCLTVIKQQPKIKYDVEYKFKLKL